MEVRQLSDYRQQSKLERKKDRLRQIDQYYEYCFIKKWELMLRFTHTLMISIGDVAVNLVEEEGRLVFVSIIFSCDRFSVPEVLDWLDNYAVFWEGSLRSSPKITGASEIVEGLLYKGQALILYKRGLAELDYIIDDFPEVTEKIKLTHVVSDISNTKEVSLGTPEKEIRIFFNGEEVEQIPDLRFDVDYDSVYANGLLLRADRVADYQGNLGIFFEGGVDLPIGRIDDNDCTISIDLYKDRYWNTRLCNIKFTYEVSLARYKRISKVDELNPLGTDIEGSGRLNKATTKYQAWNSMRFNNDGLPMLTGKLLNRLFEGVYGWPSRMQIKMRTYLDPLRYQDENPNLKAFLELIDNMSMYNCQHRTAKFRQIYRVADPILGPFTLDSIPTTLWLGRILAIKELYGLNDSELQVVLRKINVWD
ncbi:MAG: hypothetical protein NTV45_01795 [Firmicutes bacterium]|nr:hypothetical protein [Bacillota bacterium]